MVDGSAIYTLENAHCSHMLSARDLPERSLLLPAPVPSCGHQSRRQHRLLGSVVGAFRRTLEADTDRDPRSGSTVCVVGECQPMLPSPRPSFREISGAGTLHDERGTLGYHMERHVSLTSAASISINRALPQMLLGSHTARLPRGARCIGRCQRRFQPFARSAPVYRAWLFV